MVYGIGKLISGFLAGSELVRLDNGGGIDVAATAGQVANAPGPAGSSSASLMRAGNINTQVSSAGVQPGATGSDYVIANFSLPASAFDAAGRTLQISAAGSFGATANNKRIKLIIGATTANVGAAVVGGTTIADTNTVATSGGGWSLAAEVTKTGALGSNTQITIHTQAQIGNAVAALAAPQNLTLNEAGAINVTVTGNATTAVSDIIFNFMQSFWQN